MKQVSLLGLGKKGVAIRDTNKKNFYTALLENRDTEFKDLTFC